MNYNLILSISLLLSYMQTLTCCTTKTILYVCDAHGLSYALLSFVIHKVFYLPIMMLFSDSNLDHDNFLKSLMDEHGWVPISKVADFNRVCFSQYLNFCYFTFILCHITTLLVWLV